MQIRKLAESDYDRFIALYAQLEQLHLQARPDYFILRNDAYPKDAFLHNLGYPGGLELGAFDGGNLVGFAEATLWEKSGMRTDLKTVCLDNIYVLPEGRRRGIAKALFRDVEDWARAQGAVRLDLHVWDFNKNALALYEAMGMDYQYHVMEKKL